MSRLTHTRTFVTMDVSATAYNEIKAKLSNAGYDHAFIDDLLDMHGIALKCDAEEPSVPDTGNRVREENAFANGCVAAALGRPLSQGAAMFGYRSRTVHGDAFERGFQFVEEALDAQRRAD